MVSKTNVDEGHPLILRVAASGANTIHTELAIDLRRKVEAGPDQEMAPLDEMDRSEETKQFCFPRDDGGELHPRMERALGL